MTDGPTDIPVTDVAVSPHRIGGGYLFVPGELLVEQNAFEAVSGVLASRRFRARITRDVIVRGFFGRDLEADEVGLQQAPAQQPPYDQVPSDDLDRVPSDRRPADGDPARPDGDAHDHAPSHGHGQEPGRLRRLLGALADTVRFLWTVRVLPDLRLAPQDGSDDTDQVLLCRLPGVRRARVTELVVPSLVARLPGIELDDRVGPLVAAPNHLGWPSRHMSSKSAVPPVALSGRQPPAPSGNAGSGVTVALLDIGVDASHPWFAGGRVTRMPGTPAGPYPLPGDGTLRAYDGHGTFLAGLVLKQAPAATILDRRVLDVNGFVSDVALAAHIRDLERNGTAPDVVVLALAGPAHLTPGTDADFMKTKAAIADFLALHPGSVVVAAAGNERKTQPFYPAAFSFVTGVAAFDGRPTAGRLACFTNRNATTAPGWVDVCSDGVAQVSAFVDTRGAPVRPQEEQSSVLGPSSPAAPCAGVPFDVPTVFNGFAVWSGSSMSTATVAGKVAAGMTGGRTARQALDALVGTGVREPYAGVRV